MSIKAGIVESVGKAAGEVMKGLDGLFTSDDERNTARVLLTEKFNNLSQVLTGFVMAQEAERTARHKADMQSDSWLSKNVRPITLIFLLMVYTVLAFADSITGLNFDVPNKYIEGYDSMLTAVFGFYFLSRGLEKVTKIITNRKVPEIKID